MRDDSHEYAMNHHGEKDDEKIRSDSIKVHVFAVKIDWFASSFAAVR